MVQSNPVDLMITSLETYTAFDIQTGALKWIADELQDGKLTNNEETTDITGKHGRLLNTMSTSKSVSTSATSAIIVGGMMGSQVGSEFEYKGTDIKVPDYLTVKVTGTGNEAVTTAVTTYSPVAGSLQYVYVRNQDGSLGKEYKVDTTAGTGKFVLSDGSGDNAGKKILTFTNADIANGTEILAYYKRHIQANVLENNSEKYAEKVALYIDAIGEDKCNNVYRVQIYMPRAAVSGNFEFDMGGNQTTHAFEAKSLSYGCNTTGAKGQLWTYTVFGNAATDYTEPVDNG